MYTDVMTRETGAVVASDTNRMHPANTWSNLPGLPLQSLDRTLPPVLYLPLPGPHIPLVGAAPRQHLRLATRAQHSW